MASKGNSKAVEAMELPVGQDHAFEIPVDGEARIKEHGRIEVVDGPRALNYQDKADALKFNEELVEIYLHPVNDENEINPIELGVNGRGVVLWRGFTYQLKRKYLERLARAKTTRIQQEAVVQNGVRGYLNHRRTAPTYPYAVTKDSPLGRAWHAKILQEP